MSVSNFPKIVVKPAQCPSCGKYFDYALYPEIRIPGDNKLKKKVLNRDLFFPKCPSCGEVFKLRASCMYRNDDRREMFIVTDAKEGELEKLMKTGALTFNDIMTEEEASAFLAGLLKRRIVYDVDSFREKIMLSDYNYDDRIIELMKLSLSKILEKDVNAPVYRIFLEETSGNNLHFTAIMGSRPPFEYINVRTQAKGYNYFRDKYIDKLGKPEADEYISTDQKWAKESGLLEDEDPGFMVQI